MTYFEEIKTKIPELKTKKDILVLGIESSCDETSVAIVKNGREVLSNIISTQIEIHRRFGGVVPEVASRNHVMAIINVLNEALSCAHVTLKDIDAIAVTYGAGLIGALMVGVSFAKALAYSLKIPIIAVNHIRGHMSANYITHKDLVPPFVGLIVSGGHTAIVEVKDYITFLPIGSTLDDAIGEAYDKVGRVLGLSYPGGPEVDRLAKGGRESIIFIKKPYSSSFDSSYSGLKTAVINYVNKLNQKHIKLNVEDICASFQKQAVLPLIDKAIRACKKFGYTKLCVAGGVSANSYLRKNLEIIGKKEGIKIFFPDLKLCTDNGAMIASMGYFNLINGIGVSDIDLEPVSHIPV